MVLQHREPGPAAHLSWRAQQKEKQMSDMMVMDQTGHTRVHWDVDDKDEVAEARKEFDALRAKGFNIFERGEGGGKGQRVTEFDPEASSYIAVPQLQGG
jgi:hypothetical protein